MAITAQQKANLLGVTSFMFNFAPDQDSFGRFEAIIEANPSFYALGTNLARTEAYQSQFAEGITRDEKIDVILGRLGLTEGAGYETGVNFIKARLDAGIPEGQVLMEIGEKMLQDPAPAGLEEASAIFQNKIAASEAYLESGIAGYSSDTLPDLLANITADAASVEEAQAAIDAVANEGETFSLTADAAGDIFVGTANNDTFTAESGALNATSVDGLGGNDTLNATYKNGTDFAFTPTIRNVENINVNIDSLAGTTNTFDAVNVRGATITLASSKLGFDGQAGASNVAANNVTAGQNVTDLTVADLTTGMVDTGAAEVASVTTDDTTDVANITVNGDIALTVAQATDAVLTTTADAEVDFAGGVSATTLTVAGEGDVTLLADVLTTDEIVNEKESGTLTASVSAAAAVGDWNVDNIQVTANSALTGVELAPVELTEEGLTVSAAGKAAATSNVVINTAVDQTSITATQAKTATVNLTAAATVGTLVVGAIDTTINVAEASEITTLTSTGEVTLAGEGDLEITNATAASVIDAAGLAGELTVKTAANDASVVAGTGGLDLTTGALTDTVAVTGNTGADVVNASSITTGTIVFEGGAGEDQLTVDVANGDAATVVFDGGEGNDKLVLANGTDLTSATVTLANVETIDVDGAAATVNASVLSGESFTITGDGFSTSTLNIAGTANADEIDLSGLTASSSVGGGGVSLVVAGGAGNDSITLGSAVETVEIGLQAAAGIDTITDFSASDFLAFNNASTVVNLVSGTNAVTFTKGTETGQFADLDAVLATFATSGDNVLAADSAALFSFDGSTYALVDGGTAGYDAAEDAVVELVGTDVTTLGAGNFVDVV